MTKMRDLNNYNFIAKVWNKANGCDCENPQVHKTHRLCGICGKHILFGAYEAIQPGSAYAWNIDHIIPKSLWPFQQFRVNYNLNDLQNCQAVHVECNREKADILYL